MLNQHQVPDLVTKMRGPPSWPIDGNGMARDLNLRIGRALKIGAREKGMPCSLAFCEVNRRLPTQLSAVSSARKPLISHHVRSGRWAGTLEP